MGSLAAEPHDVKLPTSPSAAPESPTTEVTKSARLIVNMKRELMELIKAEHYETALTVCDRRTLNGSAPPTFFPWVIFPHPLSLSLVSIFSSLSLSPFTGIGSGTAELLQNRQ